MTDLSVAADTATPTVPETLPEQRQTPTVVRRPTGDYWDLAAGTWVRCPDR
jgi:hypothetical protein